MKSKFITSARFFLLGLAAALLLTAIVFLFVNSLIKAEMAEVYQAEINDEGVIYSYTTIGIDKDTSGKVIAIADDARRLACKLMSCASAPFSLTIYHAEGPLSANVSYNAGKAAQNITDFFIDIRSPEITDLFYFIRHEMAHIVCAQGICPLESEKLARGPNEAIATLIGGYWPQSGSHFWIDDVNFNVASYAFNNLHSFSAEYVLTTNNYPPKDAVLNFYGDIVSLAAYLWTNEGGLGKWLDFIKLGAAEGFNEVSFAKVYQMSFSDLDIRWARWRFEVYPKLNEDYAVAVTRFRKQLEKVMGNQLLIN